MFSSWHFLDKRLLIPRPVTEPQYTAMPPPRTEAIHHYSSSIHASRLYRPLAIASSIKPPHPSVWMLHTSSDVVYAPASQWRSAIAIIHTECGRSEVPFTVQSTSLADEKARHSLESFSHYHVTETDQSSDWNWPVTDHVTNDHSDFTWKWPISAVV